MQEKIEWYQEVLELEPGSKVFFPLARLLGQTDRHEEAVKVLRNGLEKHPEFIEARLLLIQLLREKGETAACDAELDAVTRTFSAYPGFWQAWSEHGPSGDAAWALRFLAASFQSPDISLRDVLFSGLEFLSTGHGPTEALAPLSESDAAAAAAVPCAPELAELAASLQQAGTPAEAETLPTSAPGQDEPEAEEVTLRTRSMAEVLADQGDVRGALEIYHEILARTPPGAEADALRERIAVLSSGDDAAPPPVSEKAEEVGEPAESNTRMRSMLESLAQRLDARAQA